MAAPLKRILDYDDYAAIPPDGKRYELIEGDVHVASAPSPRHQWASRKLERQLEDYFEGRGIGRVFNAPIDVILTRNDVVQPDLVLVTDPTQISSRGIEGAPELLVEVLSSFTETYDRNTKARRYAALGIRHLWFVDTSDRRIEAYRLEGSMWSPVLEGERDDTLTHPDWPGLTIRVSEIWL